MCQTEPTGSKKVSEKQEKVRLSDFGLCGFIFSLKQRLKNDSIEMKRASFSAGPTLHSGCKDGF